MSVIRVAFLGTPDIAAHCLKGLAADEHFNVVGVVTQPDRPAGRSLKLQPSPVKLWAESRSLPVLAPENINDSQVISQIEAWRPEALVVVAFGQILKEELLNKFPRRIVNIHASLLPRWRGAAPIQRAIMAGDEETGVSLQMITRKLDAGDVLGRRKIPTGDLDALQLLEAMKPLASDLLAVELMDFMRGHLTPVAQDESFVTYAPKIDKSEARIDWTQSAEEILRNIRGLKMGPGSFCLRDGKSVKVHQAKIVNGQGRPGEILSLTAEGLVVACGEKALLIYELQPESRSKMNFSDYQKGHNVKQGELWL